MSKFGEEIVENEKIAVHISTADKDMVKIGTLPSGGALLINRLCTECDLLVAEGFIEPHFFAGFFRRTQECLARRFGKKHSSCQPLR